MLQNILTTFKEFQQFNFTNTLTTIKEYQQFNVTNTLTTFKYINSLMLRIH